MSTYGRDVRRIARLERRARRLGPDPSCEICHVADIRCLVKLSPRTAPHSIRCQSCRRKRRKRSAVWLHRRRQQFEANGYPDARCTVCGESDLRTLDINHLAGAANSALVAPYCANCHAHFSDQQQDLPAGLLLRDPDRRPLALQAAFNFGLSFALILIAAIIMSSDSKGNMSQAVFYGVAAAALTAWGMWDLAADQHLAQRWGADYSLGVPAEVPR
jgi:hypothetical protein